MGNPASHRIVEAHMCLDRNRLRRQVIAPTAMQFNGCIGCTCTLSNVEESRVGLVERLELRVPPEDTGQLPGARRWFLNTCTAQTH